MRHFLLGLIVVLMLLLGVAAVAHAQDSTFAPDYNWCHAGEPWGDGRCNNFDDPTMIYCHWQMGWYLPRVQAGEYRLQDIASPCLTIVTVDGDCASIVVVLQNSPYTGNADINVGSDDFDSSSANLGTYCGLEIHGNDNDNFIIGSMGNDVIYGYGGDDDIVGDTMCGNANGADVIDGGDGNDLIVGDTVCGDGSGSDTINGGDGNDEIYADSVLGNGSGNDTIDSGDGDDFIYGDSAVGDGSGDDNIDSGSGDDEIYGDSALGNGSGDDTINAGDGDDIILGDTALGDGTGNDTIDAGAGDDEIYGDSAVGTGSGDDTIDGGADTDSASGSGNSDDTTTNVETDTSTVDN